MASEHVRPSAALLLYLNFLMHAAVLLVGAVVMNSALNDGFIVGAASDPPPHYSIYFPVGNAATGFFVTSSLIAGAVGIASYWVGAIHLRSWSTESFPSAASAAVFAWAFTLLAMGFASKEIQLQTRNAALVTMEVLTIVLAVTQMIYIGVIIS